MGTPPDLAVLGVLGQVNGRAHTQRQYDQKRQQDDMKSLCNLVILSVISNGLPT